ncbi:MAG: chitobiase/beta-hexosaminidase C-terminal domain-containing protein [Prevotella sp.]|nr:chitobiase/beta-hexosaminidase C-terminal domain-containing protein [Prevotella sp.]
MALKVKADERLLKFNKETAGEYRYVMKPELYIALSQKKVIREAALRSGVSQGVMQACWDAAGEVIKAWATEGHSVALPGLGSMRFGLRSKSVADVNDVRTGLIKSRRIVFTPSVDLKEELSATAIVITCYDRNGNEVKRVTSTSGEVEDNEENENENENSGSGSSTGSETESIMAPEITGPSPFTDSTQVTIQGPQGAEVRYTTDGSAPSAESTLYSEAITLNATTTIKAIAILNGETSEVTSKTFTKSGESGGFDLGN